MSSLSVRLPESLHQRLRELAERDDISINQFIATAVAEKAAALLTVDYLTARGQRANVKLMDRLLSRVPDVPPIRGDELPAHEGKPNKTYLDSSVKRRRVGSPLLKEGSRSRSHRKEVQGGTPLRADNVSVASRSPVESTGVS